ncbi:helix-turn-helix domain-containing protein [Carnobacterium gallinarum]|uniref:helix-turn-helix domain-containing protein n=1 Tax=Carnobacterium gallinarum TaxID=2749 RepID=UPI001FDEC934|nr:helix-turn-helix domain-containing protein [Carnobacterium gallinarum]
MEKISLRKLYLLSLLYSQKKSFMIKELEKELGYNNKTIVKMIQTLQIELEPWKDQIKLVINPDKTLYLEKEPSFSLETIKLTYLKQSYIFKACCAIFNEEFVDIATFSNANYISYSTLYGRLNEIKPLLKSYQIEFKSNNIATFEGEEKQIRYFFYHFYWGTYWGTEWPFKGIDKEKFTSLIGLIEKIRRKAMYISEWESFAFWLGVIATRIELGHVIEHVELYDPIIEDSTAYSSFEAQVLTEFQTLFPQLEHGQLINEIKFFYSIYYSNTSFEINDLLISETLVFSQNKKNELFEVTNYWLKEWIDLFNLSLTAAEYGAIYANLVHLHAGVYFFEGNIDGFFYDEPGEIKSNNSEDIYDSLMDYFYEKLISNRKYKDIFSQKNRMLPNYKLIARKFIKVDIEKNPVRIYLISIHGNKEMGRLERLIRQTSGGYNIEFADQLENVDLIVSDRMYAGIVNQEATIIIWGENPNENEVLSINLAIKEILLLKVKKNIKEVNEFQLQ